jgi:hypothetical protein
MATNSQIKSDAFSNERFLEVANRAVAEAVEKHRRLGESIIVMRNGKVTWLAPEEIPPLREGENGRRGDNLNLPLPHSPILPL